MGYFSTIYSEDLPHRAKTVYMYLKDMCNRNAACWPGIKTIAADLGLSRSTVKRAIKDLTQHGLIQKEPRYRENGSNSSNMYSINETRI